MSWIVSYWMDLLELWKQVSAITSLLHVSPVTEIKKQIKVFIYYIMLSISSNVPHIQNYYSMRRSSKKIETDEEMHRKRRLSLKKSRLTYVRIIHAVK